MKPVKYIELTNSNELISNVLFWSGVSLGVAMILVGVLAIFSKPLWRLIEKHSLLWVISGFATIILVGLALTLSVTGYRSSESADLYYGKIQAQAEDSYGVKLSRDQIEELDYPRVKPAENFKVFGSFDDRKQIEGANFETRKVYLVWADGKLNLSQSTDGESFTELKSKD